MTCSSLVLAAFLLVGLIDGQHLVLGDRFNCSVVEEFTVSVNCTVHFPCYAVSVDEDVKSARWKKNGQSVVRMSVASEKNITEQDYNRRVSVPTDWFSKNDFTLTLGPVQLQDQGDWTCSIQYENGTSRKFVARLTVHETRNQTRTEQPGPVSSSFQTACVAIAVVVALVLCAVAFGIRRCMRSRRLPPPPLPPPPPPPPPRAQREGAQEDAAVPLVSQNEPGVQPNGLEPNGHR